MEVERSMAGHGIFDAVRSCGGGSTLGKSLGGWAWEARGGWRFSCCYVACWRVEYKQRHRRAGLNQAETKLSRGWARNFHGAVSSA